jgi:hypothetical protein
VVLTPGVCASSLAVMWRPDRARASAIRERDGGNSAALPGESTKDTVKTIRAGKAGRSGETCGPPRVHFYGARTCGCQPAPGLPCALVFFEGDETKQNSGDMRRENAALRLLFEA